MDGLQSQKPKVTSDEEISSPEPTDDEGVSHPARSYDCIYCKRGFTTAQALGGHMNVHRKERDRRRQNPVPPAPHKTMDYSYSGVSYGYYSSYSSYQPFQPLVSEFLNNYTMYFQASISGFCKAGVDDFGSRTAQEHNVYGEDLNLDLGMNFDDRHVEDEEYKVQDEDDGLDLKLRLGYE